MSREGARTLALTRGFLYLAALVVAYLVLWRLAAVIAPVATGLFLAYLLNPLVSRLERRGVPRGVATALLTLGIVAAVGGVVLVVPPLVARELRAFGSRWDEYRQRIEATLLPWLRLRLQLQSDASLTDTVDGVLGRLGGTLEGMTGNLASAALGALQTATGLLRVLVGALLTPVFAIYFLRDYPSLSADVFELVPPRHRAEVMGLVGEVNHALASWLRGQLTVMLILAALYAGGLALTGIPLGVGIGILTGLLAFVPYVGVGVGLVLAVGAALIDYHGAGPLVGVVAIFAGVQLCDALLITPRVLGGRVGLSAVAVIFALFLGGDLLGYVGLLLAVPSAAVCKVLLTRARRAYVESRMYRGAAEPIAALAGALGGGDAPAPAANERTGDSP